MKNDLGNIFIRKAATRSGPGILKGDEKFTDEVSQKNV